MPSVSVLILAKNEAANIEDCIESARGVDEIIVIDDESDDDTRALAEAKGAKVVSRKLTDFSSQYNFAQEQAAGDWIFCLDADERFTPELMAALRRHVAEKPGRVGLAVRHNRAFGKELRFGPLRPDWVPRLFPKNSVKWSGLVHSRLEFNLPADKLEGHLIHHTYKSWDHYLKKLDRYAALWAEDAYARGKRASQAEACLRLGWNLFKMFIVNLGVLGGPTTWALCYFNGAYTLSKYLRLNELNRK